MHPSFDEHPSSTMVNSLTDLDSFGRWKGGVHLDDHILSFFQVLLVTEGLLFLSGKENTMAAVQASTA